MTTAMSLSTITISDADDDGVSVDAVNDENLRDNDVNNYEENDVEEKDHEVRDDEVNGNKVDDNEVCKYLLFAINIKVFPEWPNPISTYNKKKERGNTPSIYTHSTCPTLPLYVILMNAFKK